MVCALQFLLSICWTPQELPGKLIQMLHVAGLVDGDGVLLHLDPVLPGLPALTQRRLYQLQLRRQQTLCYLLAQEHLPTDVLVDMA